MQRPFGPVEHPLNGLALVFRESRVEPLGRRSSRHHCLPSRGPALPARGRGLSSKLSDTCRAEFRRCFGKVENQGAGN